VRCNYGCLLWANSGFQTSEEAVLTWLNSKQKAASVGGLDPRTKIQIRYYKGSMITVVGMFLLTTGS
jgi:hypothetical protein